jgi:diguanylate cyclase (GGDEF)-like protein/PAS domain S-box-containing protein
MVSAGPRQLDSGSDFMETRDIFMATQDRMEIYRFMIESSRDIVFLLDEQGRFVYLNDRVQSLLGYNKQDLLGKHFSHLLHPDDIKHSESAYADCINKSGNATARGIQIRVKRNRGRDNFRYFDIKLSAIPETLSKSYGTSILADTNEHGRLAIYGVARDITQLKSLENIIHTNTNYDHLTGLPNRALLKDRIKQAMARARRESLKFAIMFIDLDGFKQVNDRFGHSAGDIVLQAVAARLTACLREEDTLARVGGDEFVLLLPVVRTPDEVSIIADKLLNEINAPFLLSEQRISLGASIGVALFPDNGDTFDRLINAADKAMYHIKRNAKNGYVFTSELAAVHRRKQALAQPEC